MENLLSMFNPNSNTDFNTNIQNLQNLPNFLSGLSGLSNLGNLCNNLTDYKVNNFDHSDSNEEIIDLVEGNIQKREDEDGDKLYTEESQQAEEDKEVIPEVPKQENSKESLKSNFNSDGDFEVKEEA